MILDNLKVAEADDPLEGLLFYAIDSFWEAAN
jgi:hypothetical protein